MDVGQIWQFFRFTFVPPPPLENCAGVLKGLLIIQSLSCILFVAIITAYEFSLSKSI